MHIPEGMDMPLHVIWPRSVFPLGPQSSLCPSSPSSHSLEGANLYSPSPASLLLFLHPSIIFQPETLSGAASILGCVTWSQLIIELGLELEMSEVRDNLFIQVARIYRTWLGHKDEHF